MAETKFQNIGTSQIYMRMKCVPRKYFTTDRGKLHSCSALYVDVMDTIVIILMATNGPQCSTPGMIDTVTRGLCQFDLEYGGTCMLDRTVSWWKS